LVKVNYNAVNCEISGAPSNLPFSYCPQFKELTIGNNVKTIPSYAFYRCNGLTSVTIPNSVTSIGIYAFYDCTALTSVTIGNSVTSIGNWAFCDCSRLTKVNYNAANCTQMGSDSYWHPFKNCPQFKELTIGNNVRTIPSYAFYDCNGLTSVTIPNSVTSIGNYAFANCSGLTSVTIPNSVTSIGNDAFYNCSGLTSVTIGNSVTSIGNKAFYACNGLISINVAQGNPSYSSEKGVFFNKDKTTLIQYPGAKTGEYTIPNTVTSIGNEAFYRCSALTSVTIGNSVTSIEGSAFYYCTGLTSVTIGNSVTTIGNYAFDNCTQLTEVINHATVPQAINVNVFSSVNLSACTLKVPESSLGAYLATNVWKDFGTVVAIVSVTGITLNQTELSLKVNETETLVATIEPADASNQTVLFSSDAPAVATVDGATGLVTAIVRGEATITATTKDGGFTATCTLTVTQPVTGVSLNKTELSLNIGTAETLAATALPANANNQTVTWESSAPAVATVDAVTGVVTAIAKGEAVITVTTEEGGFTATCAVTVTQPVTGITLNQTELSLKVNETETLVATIEPADASNQTVLFSSDAPAVATVDGATGLVTAIARGEATITATTKDGGFTATCTLTVTQPVTGASLNKTELSLNIGTAETLVATVLPANANNQTVAWSSSNPAVATVDAVTGVVTAIAKGEAVITVTTEEGGFTANCAVSVKSVGINDNTLTTVTVYCSGNSVCIVNSNNIPLKSVQIADVLGRVVYDGKAGSSVTIPVNSASGIYIVRIVSDDNRVLSTKVHLN
jgi:uncharacterized protein YjdB